MASAKRSRVWATIVYPDWNSSSPDLDIFSLLESTHVPCVCSPLHDSDVKEDGTVKKAHFHVLFRFSTAITTSRFQSIISSLNSAGAEAIADEFAYYRYLTHADSPDKAQYDDSGLVFFSGYISPAPAPKPLSEAFGELIHALIELGITDMRGAYLYASEHPEYMSVICDRAFAVRSVLDSFRGLVDPEC